MFLVLIMPNGLCNYRCSPRLSQCDLFTKIDYKILIIIASRISTSFSVQCRTLIKNNLKKINIFSRNLCSMTFTNFDMV